jgi:glycerate 2-kinase
MNRFIEPETTGNGPRAQALDVLAAGLAAVDPGEAIRRFMIHGEHTLWIDGAAYNLDRFRRIFVIGGGKASASMAAAVEELLAERITAGWVNVKYGYTAHTEIVTVHEAGHPVPDAAGVEGTRQMLDLLRDVTADDLVLCLISGGGSALLTQPVNGVSLDDVQAITDLLLRSGAPIQAINAVRKHLSRVKGGQLARLAYPATVISMIVSDVVGSPLDVIASGPTVPDPTTYAHAQAVIERYGIADEIPASIRQHLKNGVNGGIDDTPKDDDEAFANVQNVIVADNARAALAAAGQAEEIGFNTLLLSTFVEGEAREVGLVIAGIAKEIMASGRPVRRPACVLMGGETTVTVRGDGTGGRNQELALAAALAIQGMEDVLIASLATDGTDGPTDAAGGLVDGTTVQRGADLGFSAVAALADNDSYPFLQGIGDLMITGPTNTNVNDLIAVFCF